MIATFYLSHPTLLVATAAILATVAAGLRIRRSATRGWRSALVALAILAALVVARTQTAYALISMIAVFAAGWLTIEHYRAQPMATSPVFAVICAAARTAAWIVALTLLARPIWDNIVIEWRRPPLWIVLDNSASMSIADIPANGGTQPRAEAVNAAFQRASHALGRLEEIYDVRILNLDAQPRRNAWTLRPELGASPLAAAVRRTAQDRTGDAAPAAVLLISDGAENIEPADALRNAAARLAEQRIALYAVGVGPPPELTAAVEIAPLAVPRQIGLRDHLRLPISTRVRGCKGQSIRIELLWNEEIAAAREVRLAEELAALEEEFEIVPPGGGVHRLTAKVTLPAERGGDAFDASVIIEVVDHPIRVLYLEAALRVETAFISRALQGDPRFELTRRLYGGPEDSAGAALVQSLGDFDVVVLGRIPDGIDRALGSALRETVQDRGAGVFFLGGTSIVRSGDSIDPAVAGLLPSQKIRALREQRSTPILATAAGMGHPLMQIMSATAPSGTTMPDRLAERLSSFGLLWVGYNLENPAALATAVAMDDRDQPVLLVQETGSGRVVLSAWESTWPWALGSDDGAAFHVQFWRQAVVWLANRRPRAWVISEKPMYAGAAVQSGQQRIVIRAGVTGLAGMIDPGALNEVHPRLTMKPPAAVSGEIELPLERTGSSWVAFLPSTQWPAARLTAGRYDVAFSVQPPGAGMSAPLQASSSFEIVDLDLERRPPTADLDLLQAVVRPTASLGGRYLDVAELPALLESLSQQDRRKRVDVRIRYDLTARQPFPLLLLLATALFIEWALRRRSGSV